MAHVQVKGFREYDARWRFPDEIDLDGFIEVGQAIGTQLRKRGGHAIVVGHDSRSYSQDVSEALINGLLRAGVDVSDIGLCLTPTAYFARGHLNIPAVAMVTASHNPNGWTGVKLGFTAPFTHGAKDMAELAEIWQSGKFQSGQGVLSHPQGVKQAYLSDVAAELRLTRPLKVVCATGNGTAGAFAPTLLRQIGAEVFDRHTALDTDFPHYNPNPEALEMLDDMARAVAETDADIALGFDGDGDRCGIVDEQGHEVFADKIGLLLARDLSCDFPNATFLVDVKSTGLYATDPVLRANGATVVYGKTGHSHMKSKLAELGALAGFEKSGHYFFGAPLGHGYDCGLTAAAAICRLLDRHPDKSMSQLVAQLAPSWSSPTMSAQCADHVKYDTVDALTSLAKQAQIDGATLAGRTIADVSTINGVRVTFDDASWALVRASSNTPTLVVVCESMTGAADLKDLFKGFDQFIRQVDGIGPYDQSL